MSAVNIDFDIPLEEYEPEETEHSTTGVEDESGGSLRYALIGAGQAGGRIAEAFYDLGYKKTICMNTAKHDLNTLKNIPEKQKLHLNTGVSQGAGKDMEVGEHAAAKHSQEIYDCMKRVFGTDIDRIFVCAGLGGGTGGGSILVLLDTARKYMSYITDGDPRKHVGAIVTLPTTGEAMSPQVANNAQRQATRLSEYAEQGEISPLIFCDNDKIQKMYPRLTVKKFWPVVNATIASLVHTFNMITTQDSEFTTFDPADYRTIMASGGCMIMGLTNIREMASETDISRALKQNLGRTLLADGFDLTTAKAAACVVIGGERIFEETQGLMTAIEYGFDTLANLCGGCLLHRGIYETVKNKLSVFTLIGGLKAPTARIQKLTKSQSTNTKSLY